MKEIVIKKLSIEDAEYILGTLDTSFFDCANMHDHWSKNEICRWIENENDLCLGAYSEGNIVGYCLSHFAKSINKVYIENIFVDPTFRRQGVGRKLLNHLQIEYANDFFHCRFIALVQADNNAAIQLLSKQGYNSGNLMLWLQKNL